MSKYTDVQLICTNGVHMRVHAVAPDTFRVRFDRQGTFAEPPLIRYGILHCPGQQPVIVAPSSCIIISAGTSELHIDGTDGQFRICASNGRESLHTLQAPLRAETSAYELNFPLHEDESFYGLGNLDSGTIERRGWKGDIWAGEQLLSSAPIPYLMSTRGWALLMNSTHKHTFDIGCTQQERLCISGEGNTIDLFLFIGNSLAELLNRYTDVAGKPQLLPQWAYGLNYSCRKLANAQDVVNEAMKFRQMNIPCDLIGLSEDCVVMTDSILHKAWHPERYPMSSHDLVRGLTFLGVMRRQGFKFSLFVRCHYDVSAEEERLASGAAAQQKTGLLADLPAWYEHLQPFTEDGVTAFVMSICSPNASYPDRRWANGMDTAEMHNIYALLVGKQMHLGYRNQTGQRPMIHVERGFTGMQQYVATSSGTYYNLPLAITDILNYGLSGHSNTTTNMRLISKEGIHSGFLLPWARIHSYHYFLHPNYLEPDLLEVLQLYARLRYRLIPYLYAAAHTASRTGLPIARAMPLLFPDDPTCRGLRSQYMLGDWLLVAAFGHRIYLPEGVWIDYWTGTRHDGLQWLECGQLPERAGGPLFVRGGAIIPLWPDCHYVGQVPVTTIALDVYPHEKSEYVLYEDDGVSDRYRDGQVAVTQMTCQADAERIVLQIGRRIGTYDGMPAERGYDIKIHLPNKPTTVTVNGRTRPEQLRRTKAESSRWWRYDRLTKSVRIRLQEGEDPARIELLLHAPSASRRVLAAKHPAGDETWLQQSDDKHGPSSEHVAWTKQKLTDVLETPSSNIAEAAFDWWRSHSSDPKTSENWHLHLLYASHLILRQAEIRGWNATVVFGMDLEYSLTLREMDNPDDAERILRQIAERFIAYAERHTARSVQHAVVREVMAFVDQNIDGDLDLKSLASHVSVHPFHLSRLFKKETGQTFSDYIMARRMLRAMQWLEAGNKVYEAASATGFKDPGNFSRAFRSYWGVPPIYFKRN